MSESEKETDHDSYEPASKNEKILYEAVQSLWEKINQAVLQAYPDISHTELANQTVNLSVQLLDNWAKITADALNAVQPVPWYVSAWMHHGPLENRWFEELVKESESNPNWGAKGKGLRRISKSELVAKLEDNNVSGQPVPNEHTGQA
jgi:hypothetical protein